MTNSGRISISGKESEALVTATGLLLWGLKNKLLDSEQERVVNKVLDIIMPLWMEPIMEEVVTKLVKEGTNE